MSYLATILEDSPAVYSPLGFEAGGTHCWDYSGNKRHLEYRNAPTFGKTGPLTSYPAGKALEVKAASFHSAKLLAATYKPLVIGSVRTFEVWAYVIPNATNMRLVGSDGANHFRIRVVSEAGTFPCAVDMRPDSATGADIAWAGAFPAKEQWVLVAIEFDDAANTVELFVNGESKGVKETTQTYGATVGDFHFGSDGSVPFNGRIAHGAVYTKKLGAARHLAHYNAAKAEPAKPPKTVYWGSLVEGEDYAVGQNDAPYDKKTTETFAEHAGRKPGIIGFSDPWSAEKGPEWDGYGGTPSVKCHEYGAIAFKSLGNDKIEDIVKKTIEGFFDKGFKEWAEAARSWGKPFFLRPLWEMNGGWYPWGRTKVTAAEYKEAWQHMYSIIAPIARNATWVWCPNINLEEGSGFKSMYPGDSFVDWLGIDGYNKNEPWIGSIRVFSDSIAELKEVNSTKPIIVCETAAVETGGVKADWYRDLLGSSFQAMFPGIKGYVNYNRSSEKPFSIESSEAAKAAFAEAISSEYFVNPEVGALEPNTKVLPPGESSSAGLDSLTPLSRHRKVSNP